MLYIPKIDDYLEILTDVEVKDFVAINFSESIKEEQNLRKVSRSLYFFLTTPDAVQLSSSCEIKKKNSVDISVFGYENKEKHPIYVSKQRCEEKHVDLLLIGEGEKKHYGLSKHFNAFMYDHLLHHGRKHFCRCSLHYRRYYRRNSLQKNV